MSEEKKVKDVKLITEETYSPEEISEFEKLINDSFSDFKEGEIIQGTISGFDKDNVVISLGFKSDGLIPKSEFTSTEEIALGKTVDIVIESVEDEDGVLKISKKRADFLKIWRIILDANENDKILSGKIVRRIKGGMVVDIMGIEAFLPGSQIDIKPIRDFDALVGETMDFKVVKVNIPTENVVVSHKVLIEEKYASQRDEILKGLEKGQILEGTVKAITDFGVFVDLNGVDGLIHITDLSWGRINHPKEVVELDQKLQVVVTDYDKDKKRISLSLKQLTPHPWDNIETKYLIGDKVAGKVVSLTEYGAFIEIEKGIEGLIHISEMSWTQHISHPGQFVSMGMHVEAVILSLDKSEKKISLGMKQLTPDPWSELLTKYPVGSHQKGIIRNLTNFGAFVELEAGVDGLIHISDLSWTKKVRHPGEIVKKGETIEVVVLEVNTQERKISLGHKQIEDNPWPELEKIYKVGTLVEGKVSKIIEKGLIVELGGKVDGFVPQAQLSSSKIKNLAYCFPIDETLKMRVIEFDIENKKIVLSVLSALKEMSDAEIEKYIADHKLERTSVQAIRKADTGKFDPKDFDIYDEKNLGTEVATSDFVEENPMNEVEESIATEENISETEANTSETEENKEN